MESVSEWQHPFVDVFKKFDTFENPKSYKGSVSIIHDSIIARKSFKLTGSILSNNTIVIPDVTADVKSCNLTGKYIYIEFLAAAQKYFCIHFEIGLKDREPGVRFTFTNMEKQYNVVGGNTLKIPFISENQNIWTIACIDIQHHLQNFGLFSKGVIKNYAGIHSVRGIQICSNLVIRGIYTSCNVYDWQSLPKEMSFKMVKGGRWSENYMFLYLPKHIDPFQVRKNLKEKEQIQESDFTNNIVEREEKTIGKRHKIENVSSMMESDSKIVGVLSTDLLLQLESAFSYSSLYNPDLLFQHGYIYYSAGSILVRKQIDTGEQLFLKGHIDYIIAMDSHEDWIVSVQQGVNSSVRIWINEKCICSFQCPYEKVQQIRLNFKKNLAMVGLDRYKRQVILIYDISKIQTSRKPIQLAKQISDFNILTLKFSPIEGDRLISCGKQNIRFWRVKNQHLPGSPVILNHHARNTVFTVFDYEYHYDDPNPLKQKSSIKRVYVGSQNGLLFQINYATHQLEQVYRLHDNTAITSVIVNFGFCITGSQDQLLRIWPMNFQEYLLQAGNDGVVTSLVINEDATQVACGTSTGTLSILDLTNNNYKTIVRSHTQNVRQMVYHPYSNTIITLSNDLTIRLWDPDQLEQTYQFNYSSTDLCLCLAGNPSNLSFTAGFQSGVLRIFDIENTCVMEQISHHKNQIVYIEYSSDGKFLVVLQKQLNMLYSPLHSHQPIKHLPVQINAKYKSASFSPCCEYLAIIGDSTTHINIWEMRSLQLVGKIFVGKTVQKIKYHEENLWVIMEDTSIRRYNMNKMTIEVQNQALHRQSLNDIQFNLNHHLLFTVGDDSFLKVWDYSFTREHQSFIGHVNKINAVLFNNNKLWTIGSQGILVWKFFPPPEKFIPPPIYPKQRKANFIKNSHNQSLSKQELSERKQPTQLQSIEQQLPKIEQRIKFSAVMRKNIDNEENQKFVPHKISMNFEPKITSYRKNRRRERKPRLTSIMPVENQFNKLTLKHFYQSTLLPTQMQYTRKIQCIKQHHLGYKMQYLMGIQSCAHDHIVWNFMYGWYAYIYDNLIIIQSLNKNRSQKIVTLPEKLSSLALTKDFKRIVVSSQFNPYKKQKGQAMQQSQEVSDSSGSQIQDNKVACIYILGIDLTIQKKLQFHPKGIQSFRLSENNKYLVSIGNFRQCTVCVWDFIFGKLLVSSYTLDKLNDIAIMKITGQGKILQFATVGRDQIHFWVLTREQKLQYYDVFIKPMENYDQSNNQLIQLTACDYLQYNQRYYLICGSHQGQLIIVQYGQFNVVWRKQVCSAEIISIRSYDKFLVLGSVDGNIYFWNYNANILQSDPSPVFNKMNLYYSIMGMYFDQQGKEGVVITSQAIYYVNLVDQFHSLLAGSSSSPVIMVKIVPPQFLLTSHQNGRLKLWNIQTAEQLKTYKWSYACTEAYFDEAIGKFVCFCRNLSIKLVNLKKFTREETYLSEQLGKSYDKIDDYVIYTIKMTISDKNSRWIFYKKGTAYCLTIVLQGKKKIIKAEKMFELNCTVNQVLVNPEKRLIIINSSQGIVSSYYVDMIDNKLTLLVADQASSRQFCTENKYNPPSVHQNCCQHEFKIHLSLSKVLNETYLAINQESQYVYFRNYMKRLTFQKLSLGGLPRSIFLQQTNKQSYVLIGFEEGSLKKINCLETDSRTKYQTVVNRPIQKIYPIKNKNSWLFIAYSNAVAMIAPE